MNARGKAGSTWHTHSHSPTLARQRQPCTGVTPDSTAQLNRRRSASITSITMRAMMRARASDMWSGTTHSRALRRPSPTGTLPYCLVGQACAVDTSRDLAGHDRLTECGEGDEDTGA